MKTVLLTGVTGYIGSRTTIQLLEKGYRVIGTTRKLERGEEIKKVIADHTGKVKHLSLREISLTDKLSRWEEVMQGVDFVQHVASPVPRVLPKDDNELIRPAKQGVLSVLEAASNAGVKRVVLTSSMAAIVYGVHTHKTFTEADWTDPANSKGTTAYIRSKVIAERAAWAFMEKEERGMELAVVNPGLVLGPVIDPGDYGTSAALVLKMMDGSLPALPRVGYSLVDVRSVADMLIQAMESPEAAGERFICANTYATMSEVADVLREQYPDRKIPKARLPDFALRLFALFDKQTAPVLVELGSRREHDNSKARRVLGWEPIPDRQSILDTAESLIKLNFI